MTPKLYLIPNLLAETEANAVLPESVLQAINHIHHYIVENVRTTRRFLVKAGIKTPIDDLHFYTLNKHTKPDEIAAYLKPIADGHPVGVISEAGCPGVADPGADVVRLAHQKGIQVVPYVGPSSILLALMASGMNGQSFAFMGYIPIKKPERTKAIKEMEAESKRMNQTRIFIEAPYRNLGLFQDLLSTCNPSTLLCVATDITAPEEFIVTKPIAKWKGNQPDIQKRPTIFLLHG